ncbi:universal stress protein [Streptomyces sp. P9-A4]|uniref:universal stress protein n=1 Tax=Streptomyces sp. P9-A4 TaxID=3072285 RepID=UPI002FC7C22C
MTSTTDRRDIVGGVDPVKNWHMALAWAADEAHLRGVGLRLVVAVPPRHDTRHVDDTPRHLAQRKAGTEALRTALAWAHARQPDIETTSSLLDGFPAASLAALSDQACLIVLGSRHLSRPEEFLSAGSQVVPVTAKAHCPVAVVVGRRGRGGYSGMRVGSVVHGLLHRAHCPVITVPVG